MRRVSKQFSSLADRLKRFNDIEVVNLQTITSRRNPQNRYSNLISEAEADELEPDNYDADRQQGTFQSLFVSPSLRFKTQWAESELRLTKSKSVFSRWAPRWTWQCRLWEPSVPCSLEW
jgi:hypothetical protein